MVTFTRSLFLCCLFMVIASPCQAGWHHRHGCGSCGTHAKRGHASHGSHGSYGGSSGGSHGGGSVAAAAPAQKPTTPAPGKASSRVPATGAWLVVQVPDAARVIINGQPTTLTGSQREFVATGLSETGRYEYEVTMLVDEGATRREVTKTVWLDAGTEQVLAFDERGQAAGLAAAPEPPAPGVKATASVR